MISPQSLNCFSTVAFRFDLEAKSNHVCFFFLFFLNATSLAFVNLQPTFLQQLTELNYVWSNLSSHSQRLLRTSNFHCLAFVMALATASRLIRQGKLIHCHAKPLSLYFCPSLTVQDKGHHKHLWLNNVLILHVNSKILLPESSVYIYIQEILLFFNIERYIVILVGKDSVKAYILMKYKATKEVFRK